MLAVKHVLRERVAVLDEVRVVALDQHIRLADGEGLVVELLPEGDDLRRGIELMDILLGDGKHASRSTSRVVDGLCDIVAGEKFAVVVEEDVDHELDDFARGIVLPCVLVVRLGESADDLLKDIAHLKIGDHGRVQVRLWRCELLEHDIEDALVRHGGDVCIKAEFRDDIAHVLRKAVQILMEVFLDIVGVVDQALKGVFAGVIKWLLGSGNQ